MPNVSRLQVWLLRGMYALIAIGLALTNWPAIFAAENRIADSHAVVQSMLFGFSLLAFLGLRYPLQMIPVLLLELIWKLTWVIAFALPMALNQGLDEYGTGVLFACAIGIVLTPIALPWKYVIQTYCIGRPTEASTSTQADPTS